MDPLPPMAITTPWGVQGSSRPLRCCAEVKPPSVSPRFLSCGHTSWGKDLDTWSRANARGEDTIATCRTTRSLETALRASSATITSVDLAITMFHVKHREVTRRNATEVACLFKWAPSPRCGLAWGGQCEARAQWADRERPSMNQQGSGMNSQVQWVTLGSVIAHATLPSRGDGRAPTGNHGHNPAWAAHHQHRTGLDFSAFS